MQRLPLHPKYREQVMAGSKWSSLRRGRRNAQPGQSLTLTFRKLAPVVVTVTRTTFTTPSALTSSDALADGFTTVAELRDALAEHYPDIIDGELFTIIRWVIDWEATARCQSTT